MKLRDVLIKELDIMLSRDGGPNGAQLIEMGLSQGNPDTDVKHVVVIDPDTLEVQKRYVRKSIFWRELI